MPTQPKAIEFREYVDRYHPGSGVKNVARDLHSLLCPGPKYNLEMDFLYRGMLVPQFIDRYTTTYLSGLVRKTLDYDGVSRCLSIHKQYPKNPRWNQKVYDQL